MSERVRGIAAGVLVVVASVGVLASTLAVWSKRTVLDNDRFTATISDIVDDPRVQDALAQYLAGQVLLIVDVEQVAADALPTGAATLAPALAATVESFVESRTAALVATDAFQDLFVGLVRRAHDAALRLLEGDDVAGVQIQGDEVVIDFVPVIADILRGLGADGLVDRLEDLPAFGGDRPPDENVQLLADRTGIALPEDFGRVVVFDSDAIVEAQDALALFQRLVVVLVVLTAALVVAAVLVSPGRRRTCVQLGIGVAVAMALAFVLSRWAQERVVDLVADPRPDGADVGAAVDALFDDVLGRLRTGIVLLALVGGLVALAAYLAGPSAGARAIRARSAQVPAFVAAHRDGLRVAVGAAALVILLIVGLDLVSLLGVAALVVVGLLIVDRLGRSAPAAASG